MGLLGARACVKVGMMRVYSSCCRRAEASWAIITIFLLHILRASFFFLAPRQPPTNALDTPGNHSPVTKRRRGGREKAWWWSIPSPFLLLLLRKFCFPDVASQNQGIGGNYLGVASRISRPFFNLFSEREQRRNMK